MVVVYVGQVSDDKFIAAITDPNGDSDLHREERSSEAEALSQLNEWFTSTYPLGVMKVERRAFLTLDENTQVQSWIESAGPTAASLPFVVSNAIYALFGMGGNGPWRGRFYKSWVEDFPKR